MKFRHSQSWRRLLVTFIVFLVFCEALVYVATTPRPNEQFMQLYVLGPNQLAAGYYPNNNPNINIREQISWYLGVTNDMGTTQLISVRVKISNQTIEPPNDTLALESPARPIAEFVKALQSNETWLAPFVWSVTNASISGGSTRILTLQLNNETYHLSNWSASSGYNFALIFELWTWQSNINSFEFGWNANGEHRVAWLQLWFNMTNVGPPP